MDILVIAAVNQSYPPHPQSHLQSHLQSSYGGCLGHDFLWLDEISGFTHGPIARGLGILGMLNRSLQEFARRLWVLMRSIDVALTCGLYPSFRML